MSEPTTHQEAMLLECCRCHGKATVGLEISCCQCAATLRVEVELLQAAVARITDERDHFRRMLDERAIGGGL